MSSAREREREARRDIQQAELNILAYHEEPIEGGDPKAADLLNALEEAVERYGRAVREADKEAARGTHKPDRPGSIYADARRDAAAAIEALEKL